MQFLITATRRLAYIMSIPLVFVLMPSKIYAYQTRFSLIRRTILEVTSLIDFLLIWINVQNETMLLHWQVFGGNFIFGKAVMVVDYATAAKAIAKPLMKNNNFMGVNIVSGNPDAFATNAGILTQSPPVRKMTRKYIDENIFTDHVRRFDDFAVREACREILYEWKQDPKMATTVSIRSTVIQVFFQLLSQTRVTKADADFVTWNYMRRFVELSLFSGYLPWLLGWLDTRKRIRQDAYFKLREYGIDMQTIDMTLFAALFSIGTLVMRCVEDLTRFGLVYEELSGEEKRNLVFEALRLYPTVTTVHRVVEKPETVVVRGRELKLTPGDEVTYPFICVNRDPNCFRNAAAMDLHRPRSEYDAVLSWSKGPHDCPGKALSIIVTVMLLDTLAERYRLSDLRMFNPAF
jgi:cytochrome P450